MTAWGEWLAIWRATWKRIARARTDPARASQVWPTSLTGSPPAGEGEQIGQHALVVARAAFGVELAYRRLLEARRDYDAVPEGDDDALAEAGFRMSSEMHALFVYADTFWDNLPALASALPGVPDLARTSASHASDATIARTARDHAEHIAERIASGRSARFGTPMTAETFRQVSGGFDGRTAYYGDETFDVDAIRDAVAAAEREARRALAAAL